MLPGVEGWILRTIRVRISPEISKKTMRDGKWSLTAEFVGPMAAKVLIGNRTEKILTEPVLAAMRGRSKKQSKIFRHNLHEKNCSNESSNILWRYGVFFLGPMPGLP